MKRTWNVWTRLLHTHVHQMELTRDFTYRHTCTSMQSTDAIALIHQRDRERQRERDRERETERENYSLNTELL